MPAKIVTVRPVEGRRIVDPRTMQPVPAEGLEVEFNSFWIRLRNAGDIEIIEPSDAAQQGGEE